MNPASLPVGRWSQPFRVAGKAAGIAIVFLTASRAVRAQPVTVDPAFAPVLISRNVDLDRLTLHPLHHGGFLAHGDFGFAGTTPVPGIAQLGADGTLVPVFAFAGPTVPPGDPVLPLADGRVLVVRSFYDAVAATGAVRFERYLADGTVDVAFTPFVIPAGYVRLVRPTSGGRFILAGHFLLIAGAAREGLARLNADGTLDTAYAPTLLGPTTVITSAVVDFDGNVTASGYVAHPAPTENFLLRFLSTGLRDSAFNPAIEYTTSPGPVDLLAAMPDGRLILGGTPATRTNADGTPDPTFAPQLPDGHIITQVVPVDADRFLAATTSSDGVVPVTSTVVLLAGNGARVFDYRTLFPGASAVQLRGLLPDGNVLIGHGIWLVTQTVIVGPTEPGGPALIPSTRRLLTDAHISRVSIAGQIIDTFVPPLGVVGSLRQVVAGTDGGVLIAGDFDLIDGVARPGLTRVLAEGGLDPAFVLPASGGSNITLYAVQPDGRLLVRLSDPLATPAGRPVIQRLLANGSRDPTLPVESALAATFAQIRDVDAVTGRIWATIFTRNVTTGESNETIVAFNADGSLAATLPTAFSEPYVAFLRPAIPLDTFPLVHDIRALPDGDVLVAGFFGRANDTPAPGIVRLNADGSVDPVFAPPIRTDDLSGPPQLLRDGRALLRTSTWVRGQRGYRTLRLLSDGTVDPTFQPPPGESIGQVDEQDDGSYVGLGSRLARWMEDGVRDLNFAASVDGAMPGIGSAAVFDADLLGDGRVYVGGRFVTIDGTARTGFARLIPVPQPGITVQPVPHIVVAGRDVVLQVAVGDAGDATFQWQLNGTDIAGATRAVLVLTGVTSPQTGEYRAVVTVGGQTYVSNTAMVVVLPTRGRLTNFSARSRVRPGGPPQIAGFITRNDTPRPVLLRAIGRGLPWDQPLHSLPRPAFGLFSGTNEIARDEGSATRPEIVAVADRVGAFRLSTWWPYPFNDDDAALALDLPGGLHTAQTTSADGGDGVSLFEFYDAAANPTAGFVQNVSLRGHTDRDHDTMIGGFIIAGEGPITLLIRAVGPELRHWDVPDFLEDPQLRLFAGPQEIAFNDNWTSYGPDDFVQHVRATETTGAFPLDAGSLSAAMLVRLERGAYTVHAVGGPPPTAEPGVVTSGEVLLELYVVEE